MTNSWRSQHQAAMTDPTDQEQPLVAILNAIGTLADRFATDYIMREGVAQLILDTLQVANNGPWGDRLDTRIVWEQLSTAATRINFNLDKEAFRDGF